MALITERDFVNVPGQLLRGHLVAPPAAMPPHEALAVAVLERLVADLRGAEREARTDARASVDGGGAACWLDCLDLSESVEAAIMTRLQVLAHPQGTIPRRPMPRRHTPAGGY